MVEAICQEFKKRSDYINEEIDTIYFGGGTPSILAGNELDQILTAIKSIVKINEGAEITLEANPEDLSIEKLKEIQDVGINRLSIGFQSSSNEKLKWMNRIHSSEEAVDAFHRARNLGFQNISVDLIYALPNQSTSDWLDDLNHVTTLNPEHISIYGLTIEDRTVFGVQRKNGQLLEVPEEVAANHYLKTVDLLASKGYNQYEVSNFSKPNFESQHNSSYWAGVPYIGLGPGAHSFDGKSRQFNIRNNAKYLKKIAGGDSYYESEELTALQMINERILTGLRTSNGIDLQKFDSDFNIKLEVEQKQNIQLFIEQGFMLGTEKRVQLTTTGFLVADEIALKLFFDE